MWSTICCCLSENMASGIKTRVQTRPKTNEALFDKNINVNMDSERHDSVKKSDLVWRTNTQNLHTEMNTPRNAVMNSSLMLA